MCTHMYRYLVVVVVVIEETLTKLRSFVVKMGVSVANNSMKGGESEVRRLEVSEDCMR